MSDIFKAYRDRVNPKQSSTPMQDAMLDTSKRQQRNLMLNSPSLSHVTQNDEKTPYPTIVSDVDTFHKRRILFLPDSDVNVGDLVKIKDDIYLATDMKKSEIYPELIAELCNETYSLLVGQIRIPNGNDSFGRPQYDYIDEIRDIPVVLNTKGYTVAENTSISLPDGTAIVKLPYQDDLKVDINDKMVFRNESYEVRNVKLDGVYKEKGFIEVQLQREVNPT